MAHIVLLGDSIFDNKVYVGDGPDVIAHLQRAVPAGSQATLLAVDGSVTADVAQQLHRVPADATHLFVSVGGNDAIMQSDILSQPVNSVAGAMLLLSQATVGFQQNYRAMLEGVLQHGLPTAVCTIYNPRFVDPTYQKVTVGALCLFNDVIVRAAAATGTPLLDLRLFFTEYDDYANEIEPSVAGGAKIAQRIVQIAKGHDSTARRSVIYV